MKEIFENSKLIYGKNSFYLIAAYVIINLYAMLEAYFSYAQVPFLAFASFIGIAYMFVVTYVQIMAIALIINSKAGIKCTLKDLSSVANMKYGRFLWTMLVIALIMFVIIIVPVFATVSLQQSVRDIIMPFIVVVSSIIAYSFFGLAPIAAVIENKGVSSFKTCKMLRKGHMKMLLIYSLMYVLSSILLAFVKMFVPKTDILFLVLQLCVCGFDIVFMPFVQCVGVNIYFKASQDNFSVTEEK